MSVTETVLIGTVPKNGAEEVRVALTSYKGTAIVDVRTFSEFGDAVERRPTKKGVSLQVGHLPALISKLSRPRPAAWG
jgi:hypothetical protein